MRPTPIGTNGEAMSIRPAAHRALADLEDPITDALCMVRITAALIEDHLSSRIDVPGFGEGFLLNVKGADLITWAAYRSELMLTEARDAWEKANEEAF